MKNATLWKRILNEGLTGPRNPDAVATQIVTAPIIVDLRVKDRHYAWEELKQIVVPFVFTWIEFRNEVDECGVCNGALVVDGGTTPDLGGDDELTRYNEAFRSLEDGRRVLVSIFGGTPRLRPEYRGSVAMSVKPNGQPNIHRVVVGDADFTGRLGQKRAMDWVDGGAFMACDTLSLLACKNVSLSPKENDPQQVRRATKRHGGNLHGYRYHTLVVRPPGARSSSPSVEVGVMPRHVCRGHYAEYGPEFGKGLLFGIHAGRFYVPPCYKGKKENGIVEKDYAIGGVA